MILAAGVGAVALAASLVLAGPAGAGSPDPARAPGAIPVRVAYTASVFRDIAANDARAAIMVWSEAMAMEMAIPAYSEVEVLPDVESLAGRLARKQADFGGVTTIEFLQIEDRLDLDPIFAVSRGGVYTVEYLVLVRRDSDVSRLTDLRGAELRLFDNPRCSLALPWLELILSEQGIRSETEFFGGMTQSSKLSAVILPVFFGQSKACLVTRDGFNTMAELNPQVGRELRVLAESPSLVPMVSFFRRDYTPSFRREMIEAIGRLHKGAAGRQILNLMQGDAVVVIPPSALEGARDLMSRWSRRGRSASAQNTPPGERQRRTIGAGQ